ncbi:N-formylglutamate deformylase [bacterium]|nr:N-formylglutamate deformylase [bacterium]
MTKPKRNTVPVLISFPHSGTFIPNDIIDQYRPEAISFIDDTDWFLPDIYSFAQDLGITTIKANYSRWVIDLNRNPNSTPLYNDGRLITGLCSTTDFFGNPIYKSGMEPGTVEIERRKELYFKPYYEAIQRELDELKAQFGQVLLYDSHSIRSVVPSIQKERFPDLILGTADGASAHAQLIATAREWLAKGPYELNYNHPFKGGNITRHFGRPAENQHALQLERCKDLYMKNDEKELDHEKAETMRGVLKPFFENLITQMNHVG